MFDKKINDAAFVDVRLNELRALVCRPGGGGRRFAIFLPCLSCGHPGRNLPLYCRPKATLAHRTQNLCKIILQRLASHSVFDWGCFSTGLTASPATP